MPTQHILCTLLIVVGIVGCSNQSTSDKPPKPSPEQMVLATVQKNFDEAQKAEAALDFNKAKTHYEASLAALRAKHNPKTTTLLTKASRDQPWQAKSIEEIHVPRVEQKILMSQNTLGWLEAEIGLLKGETNHHRIKLVKALIESRDFDAAATYLDKKSSKLTKDEHDALHQQLEQAKAKTPTARQKRFGPTPINKTIQNKHIFEFARILHNQPTDKALAYLDGIKDRNHQKSIYKQLITVPYLQKQPPQTRRRLLMAYLQYAFKLEEQSYRTLYTVLGQPNIFGFDSRHDITAYIVQTLAKQPPNSHALSIQSYLHGLIRDKQARNTLAMQMGTRLLALRGKTTIPPKLYGRIFGHLKSPPTKESLALMKQLQQGAPSLLAAKLHTDTIIAKLRMGQPVNLKPLSEVSTTHLNTTNNTIGDVQQATDTLKFIRHIAGELAKKGKTKSLKQLTKVVETSLKQHQQVAKAFKDDARFNTMMTTHHMTLLKLYGELNNHPKIIAHLKAWLAHAKKQTNSYSPYIRLFRTTDWKRIRAKDQRTIDELVLQFITINKYEFWFPTTFEQWLKHKIITQDYKTIERILLLPRKRMKNKRLNWIVRLYTQTPPKQKTTAFFLTQLSKSELDKVYFNGTSNFAKMCKQNNCLDQLYAILISFNLSANQTFRTLTGWMISNQYDAVNAYIKKLPADNKSTLLTIRMLERNLAYGKVQWKDAKKEIERIYAKARSTKDAARVLSAIQRMMIYTDHCREIYDFLSAKKRPDAEFAHAAGTCTWQKSTAPDYPTYTAKLIMRAPAKSRIRLLTYWIRKQGVLNTPTLHTALKPYAAKRIGPPNTSAIK